MLVSNIRSNNSLARHLNPLLTYVASVNGALKHHSRATSNAKNPTPEKLRTFDAIFFGPAYRQPIAANSPKGCGLVMVTSTIVPTINAKPATARNSMPVQRRKTMLDVAVSVGAGYIDMVATVGRSGPRPRRTNGCTADRESTLLEW
jgi:hypothetical protein